MGKIRGETRLLKSICAVVLAMALVLTGLFPENIVSAKSQIIPNDKTGIPDKNLYQAILFELGKKSDQKITEDDLEEVYSIGDYFIEKNKNKKVKNLKGLEKFENLYRLEIPINGLTSLKGIDKIPKLEYLTIRDSKLKNLDVLKNMQKLQNLNMRNITVQDWSGISELTKLTNLEIYKCNFKNFKQISGLTNLEYLTINKTKLKNLKGIENLTNLKGLYASNNRLTNLSGVEKLTQLEDLFVPNNKLSKLPSLKKLKKFNLEFSTFVGNKISEKEFKKKLPSKVPRWWINNEVILQKTKKKLEIKSKEDINGTTNKITGVTEKKAKVVLMTLKGEEIQTVKANKKGKFSLDGLDLTLYQGKKLKIVAYKRIDDQINGEGGYVALKTVKFKVRNK